MMRKLPLILVSMLAGISWAGFQSVDFFKYVVSYKTAWGTTRHKVYEIPIWDEQQAFYWLGYHFLMQTPTKGYATSFANGKEWIGLTTFQDNLRGLWMKRSDGTYNCFNMLSYDSTLPKLNDFKSLFADEDGYAYFQSGAGARIVSGVIDQSSIAFQNWHTDSTKRNYVGITGIGDKGTHKAIALSANG